MGYFGYSRFQGGFSRFQVGFMVFEGFRLVFYCSRSVFNVFKVPGLFFNSSKWVFMVFQGFRLVFRGFLRVNHGSRLVFIVTG